MSTLSILRHALKLNAAVVYALEVDLSHLKLEAKAWKGHGETAYYLSTCDDIRKIKVKIAKAADMQKRLKTEIAAIFRIARIERKYLLVFGKLPQKLLTTTYEQEKMLDTLLAEREAAAKEVQDAESLPM